MIELWKMLGGYCRLRVSGEGKERFLNLCKNKRILIWNLICQQEEYSFCVSYKAYQMIEEFRKKTNIQIRIEGKYGLPFFLYRNRKRKLFFMGIVLSLSSVFLCSLFLWNITIDGAEKYTADEIRTYLTEHHIKTGMLKKKIDCTSLEEKIREDFEDVVWVSCDLKGTGLSIHIKETLDDLGNYERKDANPNDIIAYKEGVIESIVTRKGTPLVKKGMEVKKGETLISGIIYYYNDYDELLETSMVSADGDIKARTSYCYEDCFPLSYYEKEYTGNIEKEYQICIAGYFLPCFKRKCSYESYDTVMEAYPLKIGRNFYLPIEIHMTQKKEYIPVQIKLKEKEAKLKSENKIKNYVEGLLSQGKTIVEKDFQYEIKDGECKTSGTVEVLESIGKIRNIP